MINQPVLDIRQVEQIVAEMKPVLCSSIVDAHGVLLVSGLKWIARVSSIGRVTVYDQSWEANLAPLIIAILYARIAKLPVAV